MHITREVITDLLPAYTSGEASADTNALVDAFLHIDPEFAALVRDERTPLLRTPIPVTLSPDLETRALTRTKQRLRTRGVLLGFAIASCALPLSFSGDSEGLQWLMLRDAPVIAGASLLFSAGLWAMYFARGPRPLGSARGDRGR